jgi:serine/threonine protein phosphatase 1
MRSRAGRRPSAPPDTRLYAIGDIHGCAELLDVLHQKIRADAARAAESRKMVIYLGDYIDRGPDSVGVVERVRRGPGEGFECIRLKGNHEDMLLRFLVGEESGEMWLFNGGGPTLESYGVARGVGKMTLPLLDLEDLREGLRARLPPADLDFYRSLALQHVEGDYVFVHAGVYPGRPLEAQTEDDLLWIRRSFLDSEADHGYMVVHGHSPVRRPEIRDNRINLDTGAVWSGRLTAMVFHGAERKIFRT